MTNELTSSDRSQKKHKKQPQDKQITHKKEKLTPMACTPVVKHKDLWNHRMFNTSRNIVFTIMTWHKRDAKKQFDQEKAENVQLCK